MVSRQRKADGRDVRSIWKFFFFPEHGHRRCCCNKPNTNAVVCSLTTPLSSVTSKGRCWEVAHLISFPGRMLLAPKRHLKGQAFTNRTGPGPSTRHSTRKPFATGRLGLGRRDSGPRERPRSGHGHLAGNAGVPQGGRGERSPTSRRPQPSPGCGTRVARARQAAKPSAP